MFYSWTMLDLHFPNDTWPISLAMSGTDLLEVPTINKAYVRAKFQGISPENMAKHMVLTYLHKLDPGIPIDNMPILWGPSHTKPVPKSLHWVGALSRAVPSAKLKKIACFGKGLLFCDKGSSGLSLKVAGWVNHEH